MSDNERAKRQSDVDKLGDGITIARGTRETKHPSDASTASLISYGGSFLAHMQSKQSQEDKVPLRQDTSEHSNTMRGRSLADTKEQKVPIEPRTKTLKGGWKKKRSEPVAHKIWMLSVAC